MKAKLEFDLPEENETWDIHVKAGSMHSAIWDYAMWLRGICKHDDPDKYNAEACREKLYECLGENGVSL
jgi:hypothetical protein